MDALVYVLALKVIVPVMSALRQFAFIPRVKGLGCAIVGFKSFVQPSTSFACSRSHYYNAVEASLITVSCTSERGPGGGKGLGSPAR